MAPPPWCLRPRGVVRVSVVVCGAVMAFGFWLFDPALPTSDRVFWTLIGLAAGSAGLVSALRARALPIEPVIAREREKSGGPAVAAPPSTASWADLAAVLVPRTIGDAAWLLLLATVGMALRAGIRAAEAGWTAESLRLLITTPIATFVVFVALLVIGWLLVIAVGGFLHLARMPRADVTASTWWLFGAIAAVAIAAPATLVVGLTDATPVDASGGGTAAIIAFVIGPVALGSPWPSALLWLARAGIYAFVVCLAGLAVARVRARPRD